MLHIVYLLINKAFNGISIILNIKIYPTHRGTAC